MRNFLLTLAALLLIVGLAPAQIDANLSCSTAKPPFDDQVYSWYYNPNDIDLRWDTSPYKPFIINGLQFRLLYPLGFDSSQVATQKYPLTIMMHGIGESGSRSSCDNNYQLRHGGKNHLDGRNSGKYNGFVMFAQSVNDYLNTNDEASIIRFVELAAQGLAVDPNRVVVHGLSGGGQASWRIAQNYPTVIAAALPMSNAVSAYTEPAYIEKIKYKAIWHSQGGLDRRPTPTAGNNVANAFAAAGANHTYSFYPDLGHGTWYRMYNEDDFFPFLGRASMLDIHPLYFKSNFCEGEAVNGKMGIQSGFAKYEWQRNGVTISGATSNELTFTQLGTYRVRFKRDLNGAWTEWSKPLDVKRVGSSVTPTVVANGPTALPTLDGRKTVTLAPSSTNYAKYDWSNGATSSSIEVTEAGSYNLSATVKNGCPSPISNTIKVTFNVNNALPAPGLPQIDVLGQNALQLYWNDNSTNESGFEIYSGPTSSGPWKLTAQLGANVNTYQHSGLSPNTRYYYMIRAVNNNGGSPYSSGSARTNADVIPPTTPANLTVQGATSGQILLNWVGSVDNADPVEEIVYEIWNKNSNTLLTSTKSTSFMLTTDHGIQAGQSYSIVVRAKDRSNNFSGYSNQATAHTYANGLIYYYYTHDNLGSVNELDQLTPEIIGITPNINLGLRTQEDRFGFKFEGYINIPATDNYTFYTSSDDGSKLYIDGAEIVDNDGAHGTRERSGTVENLTAGMHKFKVTYYENGGGQNLWASWKSSTIAKATIPASAFTENFNIPSAPNAPSNLQLSTTGHSSINLSWQDNSNNETGFEILRSVDNSGPYVKAGTTAANATSFNDTGLEANTKYYYKVRAFSASGESGFADDQSGLDFNYHEGSYSSLASIIDGSAAVRLSGKIDNFSIEPRLRNTSFAFRWNGKINIPTAGEYTFYTRSDDGSSLYIDGNLVVNNDYDQGMTERSGNITLTKGMHDIMVGFRQGGGGYGLEVSYQGPGINKQFIPNAVLTKEWPSATTQSAPPGPNAPTNLTATASGTNTVSLNWNDAATNETGFEVFRNDILLATIEQPNRTSYTDGNVVANTAYTYKVRAYAATKGNFSNEVTLIAGNSAPVLAEIGTLSSRYSTTTSFELRATDTDGDDISFSATGLPSICSLINNYNGTATLVVTSTSYYDQRTYSNIVITATDAYGNEDSETISLVINKNWLPQIADLGPVSLVENEVLEVTIAATDPNNDLMTFSLEAGTPAFFTLTPIRNGAAKLTIAPAYNESGEYDITCKVIDSRGGVSRKTFPISVVTANVTKIVQLNFNHGFHLQAPAGWNNFGQNPKAGTFIADLLDDEGNSSGIRLDMLSQFGISNQGPNTGSDAGVYPDAVLNTYISGPFGNTNTRTFKLSGLNPELTYNFELFGSTAVAGSGISVYSLNGVEKTLATENNLTNTVRFLGMKSDNNGEIVVGIRREGNSGFAVLNSIIIGSMYDDGSVPLAPTNLSATLGSGGEVSLSWVDKAVNEIRYEVQRSLNGGNYTTIATLKSNITVYNDLTCIGRNTYAYRVRAIGNQGDSDWTAPASVSVPNRPPSILNLPFMIGAKEENITEYVFDLFDREGDAMQISAQNLPPFASLSKISATQGKITITNPTTDMRGNFENILVTVSDGNEDDVRLLTIRVIDSEKISTLINFNMTGEAPVPWNNVNGRIYKNSTIPNLTNELNQNSGYTLTMMEAWNNGEEIGAVSGDDTGRYPDEVTKTYIYSNNANSRPIKLSGLTPGKRYNVRFFASSMYQSLNGSTRYSGGGQTVDLGVQANIENTVQLNGLLPDANGEITVSAAKLDGSFAYLNAMEVLEYDNNGSLLRPDNLKAYGSKNQRQNQHQVELSWEDNCYQETGYTVQRRVAPNGSFSTIANLPANTTSYLDTDVVRATNYEYRVRANNGGSNSQYSLVAKARTLDHAIYINFHKRINTVSSGASRPWNNTDRVPLDGSTWSNLRRAPESGDGSADWVSTSTDLKMEYAWEGANPFGMAANNTGIYEDRVVRTFYFNEIGTISVTNITDLNPNQYYNIRFFASSDFGTKNGVTEYRINNKKAYLDVQNNLTNTVVIRNVKPDDSGVISIEAEAGPTARYAYLSAMVIEAQGDMNNNAARLAQSASTLAVEKTAAGADISLYPNPNQGEATVSFTATVRDKAILTVRDVTGRLVYEQRAEVQEGSNQISLNLRNEKLKAGVYLLRVKTSEFDSKIIRFVKQ